MKKSEVKINCIMLEGELEKFTFNSEKLATSLIDYMYKLSEKYNKLIDIYGINISAAIDYALEEMPKQEEAKNAAQKGYIFSKEYIEYKEHFSLILGYLGLAVTPNYLGDNDYAEAVELLFIADRLVEQRPIDNLEEIQKKLLSQNGKKAVMKKLANDPIQKAKSEIQTQYSEKKAQFKRRGYSAQFIREMKEKYPVIVDLKTIERLVAKLNRNNEHIPPKLA